MTVRPPRALAPKNIWTGNSTALDYDIAQEKASTLGRLGRALEGALAALRDFDSHLHDPAEAQQGRRALVAAASRALWHFVVQREALGLRDSRQVMRDYRVPREVQSRMGAIQHR